MRCLTFNYFQPIDYTPLDQLKLQVNPHVDAYTCFQPDLMQWGVYSFLGYKMIPCAIPTGYYGVEDNQVVYYQNDQRLKLGYYQTDGKYLLAAQNMNDDVFYLDELECTGKYLIAVSHQKVFKYAQFEAETLALRFHLAGDFEPFYRLASSACRNIVEIPSRHDAAQHETVLGNFFLHSAGQWQPTCMRQSETNANQLSMQTCSELLHGVFKSVKYNIYYYDERQTKYLLGFCGWDGTSSIYYEPGLYLCAQRTESSDFFPLVYQYQAFRYYRRPNAFTVTILKANMDTFVYFNPDHDILENGEENVGYAFRNVGNQP